MLGKISWKYFCFPENRLLTFHANCLQKTICMKCHSLFSGGKIGNIINLLAAEFADRERQMLRVKSPQKHAYIILTHLNDAFI